MGGKPGKPSVGDAADFSENDSKARGERSNITSGRDYIAVINNNCYGREYFVNVIQVSSQKLIATLRHSGQILSVNFNATGTQMLTGSDDNSVRLWDIAGGQLLATFKGHTSAVWCVTFNATGTQVLSGGDDNSVRLWDIASGKNLKIFEGHTATVRCLAFNTTGTQVLSGSDDKTIRLWKVANGRLLKTIVHTAEVCCVAFNATGTQMLSGGIGGKVLLWEVASGRLLKTFEEEERLVGVIYCVAFNATGTQVLSGSSGVFGKNHYAVRLWDVVSGHLLGIFEGHTAKVFCVAFNATGTQVMSGSEDNTVRLWEVASGQCLKVIETLAASGANLSSISPSIIQEQLLSRVLPGDVKEGKEIAEAFKKREALKNGKDYVAININSIDGEGSWVEIIQVSTLKRIATLEHWHAESVVFNEIGTQVVSGGRDNRVCLWDVASGKCLKNFEGHTERVNCVAINVTGTQVLSGSNDNTIRLWDVANGKVLKIFEGHKKPVNCVALNTTGKQMLSASFDNTVRLWDVANGQLLKTFKEEGHDVTISYLAFDATGTQVLLGWWGNFNGDGYDYKLNLWDVGSDRLVRTFQEDGNRANISCLAFDAAGTKMLMGCYGNFRDSSYYESNEVRVHLWELASGLRYKSFRGHKGVVHSVAFNMTGTQAVSGSRDNTIRLWDIESGNCLKRIEVWSPSIEMVGCTAYTKSMSPYIIPDQLLPSGLLPGITSPSATVKPLLMSVLPSQSPSTGLSSANTSAAAAPVPVSFSGASIAQRTSQTNLDASKDNVKETEEELKRKEDLKNRKDYVVAAAGVATAAVTQPITSAAPSNPMAAAIRTPAAPTPTQASGQTQSPSPSIIMLTAEQHKFIITLQASGFNPTTFNPTILATIQAQVQRLTQQQGLLAEDHRDSMEWIRALAERTASIPTNSELKMLVEFASRTLQSDSQAKLEQEQIDKEPKLQGYQSRLQQELCRFLTCYYLAPAGVFHLEDNKKDAIISAISGAPVAGYFLKPLTAILSFANKKYRFLQMNRLADLFKDTSHIVQVCCQLSRQVTVAKKDDILKREFVKHEGWRRIFTVFDELESFVEQQWRDLAISDTTGLTVKAEDKLAIWDGAYLLQQVMSGDAKIEKEKDLSSQFVSVLTGKPYTLDVSAQANANASARANAHADAMTVAAPMASAVTKPASPVAPLSNPVSPISSGSPPSPASPPSTASDDGEKQKQIANEMDTLRKEVNDLKRIFQNDGDQISLPGFAIEGSVNEELQKRLVALEKAFDRQSHVIAKLHERLKLKNEDVVEDLKEGDEARRRLFAKPSQGGGPVRDYSEGVTREELFKIFESLSKKPTVSSDFPKTEDGQGEGNSQKRVAK